MRLIKDRAVTNMEMEVWQELCRGLNKKEIATKFNLGEKTISTHMLRLYNKLDLHTVQQIIVEGYKRGILSYPSANVAVEIIGLKQELSNISIRIKALMKEYSKDISSSLSAPSNVTVMEFKKQEKDAI